MSDIQYIHNFLGNVHFTEDPAKPLVPRNTFSAPTGVMPSENPDEAVIRAINFNGLANDTIQYLVWCNLKSDFIGSFAGSCIAPHSPQTRIWLNSPVPNMLEFKLYARNGDNVLEVKDTTGDLTIQIDFIKYRRIAPHA
jgi:hypothetical protein